jgi:hypothetical protein
VLSQKLVCSTDHAVIFASKQGVKMLQGSTVTTISTVLQGNLNRIDPQGAYAFPTFYDLISQYLSDALPLLEDIRQVVALEGMQLLYDYHHSEVWLCAPGIYNVAYIYNIASQQWTMRTLTVDRMLSDYPYLYGVNLTTLYNLSEDDTSAEKLPFVYISNPVGGIQRTHIAGIVADGRATKADISLHIAVGNNPYSLKVVSRRLAKVDILTSSTLHASRIPASIRYLRFAISGKADTAQLHGLIMSSEPVDYNSVK